MRAALSHDWLNGMRGGEKCLEVFCELYPESDIYTLFYEKGKVSEKVARHPIYTSALQRAPKIFEYYRYYLPFYPRAMGSFHLKGYDLLISTSHCAAKGIKKNPGAIHIAYCFTPMRYAWVLFNEYFGGQNRLSRYFIRSAMERLKKWDLRTNESVDHFVAISNHVQKRINQHYGREAVVIYPPVDTEFYRLDPDVVRENFYLIVSALVPYKKVDVAVRAFNKLGRELIVIGSGPELGTLKKEAKKNIYFLNWQPDDVLRNYYQRARALVFPGEEDFGIVPVEAQACGCPVIAYKKGGALETVRENISGTFFEKQTEEDLSQTVLRFERENFSQLEINQAVLRFGRDRFKSEIKAFIESVVKR